jgi:hypothetical protein
VDRDRLTALLGDQLGGLLVPSLADVGDGNAGSTAGERQGGDPSDAAGRAGDERSLPGEVAVLLRHA